MIGIANIGIGTTQTVQNMLSYLDIESEITKDASSLSKYSHLILPGVGHYSEGSNLLSRNGWAKEIKSFAESKPILGICLGMQLLGAGSEEGEGSGLNLLDFAVSKIIGNSSIRSPHMGWNSVSWVDKHDAPADERFYFVHGYYVDQIHEFTIGTTFYGQEFTSVIRSKNIWGFQFHPEKSHRYGMNVLREFAESI